MARKLLVRLLACVCVVLAFSDSTYIELLRGKLGVVPNPRITDGTFAVEDIDSAYWYKGLHKAFLISNFGGRITLGDGLPVGKYNLSASFALLLHNVSRSDSGPYVWQLIPKAAGLLEGVVNITTVASPEHVVDVTPTTPRPNDSLTAVYIISAVAVVFGLVAAGGCVYKRRNENSCWKAIMNGDHEAIPMTDIDSEIGDPLAVELKEFYKVEMKTTSIHPQQHSRTRQTEDMYIFPDMFQKDDQKRIPVKSLDGLMKLFTKKNRRVAVTGSAGCGKMALMGKIGYDWACDHFTEFKYVVILRTKEIRGSGGVVEAVGRLLPTDSDVTRPQLKDVIKKHKQRVLVIVNGSFLLESSDDLTRPASEGDWSLKDVLSYNALRGCSLLITISRHQLDKLQKLHSGYTVVETTGFSPKNVEQYIKQFFNNSDEGKSLFQKVQSDEAIGNLAKSPIMLQVLCLIWEVDNSLPQQIANVYDRAVDVLAKHISCDGLDQSDGNQMDSFKVGIGEVAFGGLVPDDERSDFSPGAFPGESLQFGLRIGVMSQETHAVAERHSIVVRFLHLYQEYFAACYLVRGDVGERLLPLVTSGTVPKMKMLLRFCCGMNDQARSLITTHLKGLGDEATWLQ